ncbi:hypothetical protein DL93DRAFT_2100961 [Clavulina sp. PMI_390]|nr:hypothetical protein DL93DRAFT_2100961 [Clavulina sp. PMI_390]
MDHNLPDVKRVVTGHNAQGQSTPIIVDDALMGPTPGSENPAKFARLWMTKETPASNDDQKTDFKDVMPERLGFIQPSGSHAFIIDMPPGRRGPTHRTSSIDYIILSKEVKAVDFLLSGSVTLLLDSDEHSSSPDAGTTVSVPGSIIVQRGTKHTWENRSTTEWARFVTVVLDAKPVELEVDKDGKKEVDVLKEGFDT